MLYKKNSISHGARGDNIVTSKRKDLLRKQLISRPYLVVTVFFLKVRVLYKAVRVTFEVDSASL